MFKFLFNNDKLPEDPLVTLRYYLIDFMRAPHVKFIPHVMNIFLYIFESYYLYFLLFKCELHSFIELTPFFIVYLFVHFNTHIFLTLGPKVLREHVEGIERWPYDNLNLFYTNKCKFFISVFYLILFGLSIVALFNIIEYFVHCDLLSERNLLYLILIEFVNENTAEILNGIVLSIFTIITVIVIVQFDFGLMEGICQIYVLVNYVAALDWDFSNALSEESLVLNDSAQKEIRKRCCIIVDRHSDFLRYFDIQMKSIRTMLIVYIILGMAFIISCLFFVFYTDEQNYSVTVYIRCSGLCMIQFLACGMVLHSSQGMETTGEFLLFQLYSLKWYTWNKENKQIYSILWSLFLKPVQIKMIGSIIVNYQLGLQAMKYLYSATSILQSL